VIYNIGLTQPAHWNRACHRRRSLYFNLYCSTSNPAFLIFDFLYREVRMMENNTKVLGWGSIIAIMCGVGVVVGLILGLLNRTLGLSPGMVTGGIGASLGVVGATLIARRRAVLNGVERKGK
jgi:hypothetical protein